MTKFVQFFNEATQFQLKTWGLELSKNPLLKAGCELLNELDKLEPGSISLIIGGTVRDLLLGKELKDVDIATNIDINKIINHFRTDNIGKSKDFGIVNVHFNGYIFEVATFRKDKYN